MIPNYEDIENEWEDEDDSDFVVEPMPSLTYAMNIREKEFDKQQNNFVGKTDGTEAIRQAVIKILNTERYEHEIYSWDYGIELKDLYGQPMVYCMSEIKVRITEALLVDDRIESVENFEVERTGKRTMVVKFQVTTQEQDEIDIESEVDV